MRKTFTGYWSRGAALLAILVVSGAQATTIDFDGLPGFNDTLGTPPANTVLTDDFMNLGVVFGRSGVSAGVAVVTGNSNIYSGNAIVGLDASGDIAAHWSSDIYFSFVVPNTSIQATTDFVSFYLGDEGGDVDQFVVSAYDIFDNVIDTQNVGNTSHFLHTINVAGIHRVEIEFLSDPAGYSLDELTFNAPANAPVPEPATISLLAMGIAGLVARRRSKK